MPFHQSPLQRTSLKPYGVIASFASLSVLCAKRLSTKSLCLMAILVTCAFSDSRTLPIIAASPNDLGKRITELIRASGAETVAVAYYDLATGAELSINPDTSFHAASTMKVPVRASSTAVTSR